MFIAALFVVAKTKQNKKPETENKINAYRSGND